MGEHDSPDLTLIFVVATLLVIGLIMILSASSIRSHDLYGDSYYLFKNQLKFAVLGIVIMLTTMKMDYHIFKKYASLIMLIAIITLILVLIPGIGRETNGSRRWLGIGPIGGQPSEFAKLALIIFLASFLDRKSDNIKSFIKGVLPPLVIMGSIFFLIYLEPDLGTAISAAAAGMVMIFAAGIKWLHIFLLGIGSFSFSVYFILSVEYRRERLFAFFDPWKDPLNTGYHTIQSLLALGSGGLFGVGIGQSHQKFLYLPEPGTDFIFAVLGEELGLLGTFFVVFLYFMLAYRGLKIAINAPDMFGSMLAVGITSLVVMQAIINIGVVTASMPVTGITLPLISYGGSSLTIILAGMGILLSISRYSFK